MMPATDSLRHSIAGEIVLRWQPKPTAEAALRMADAALNYLRGQRPEDVLGALGYVSEWDWIDGRACLLVWKEGQ